MTEKQGLRLVHVSKIFDATAALMDVSFDVTPGTIVALLGPSGSGKSTILNIIAGIEEPDEGDVHWDGQSILSIPIHQRGFSLMFQDYMLFPHMNVFSNVAFSLQMAKWPNAKIDQRVEEMLELVGLPEFRNRRVDYLSGGEQQRVALARALAFHPRLLLLDEPLGALDRLLRERLVFDLRSILQKTEQTALYVTHDQEEAFVIADKVILLKAGEIVQQGTPQEIYAHPKNEFAARFLGLENILDAQLVKKDHDWIIKTRLGSWQLAPQATMDLDSLANKTVKVLLRPDSISLEANSGCLLHGIVQGITFRGSRQRINVKMAELDLVFELPAQASIPAVGETIDICFDSIDALQLLEP